MFCVVKKREKRTSLYGKNIVKYTPAVGLSCKIILKYVVFFLYIYLYVRINNIH